MMPKYYLEEEDHKLISNFPFNLFKQDINQDIPAHGHNFLEIHYITEGHGTEIINGVEYEIHPGTFALVLPNQLHQIRTVKGITVSLFNFGIPLKFFFDNGEDDKPLSSLLFDIDLELSPLYLLDDTTQEKFIGLFNELHSEFTSASPWNKLMFKSKLIELFIVFDRYRKANSSKINTTSITPTKGNIWAIINYVYKNYREDITLKRLAELFNLSEPYISISFKHTLGINLHTFLNRMRIEYSCSLLSSNKNSITDIAYEAGFDSYSTFVRCFNLQKGVSPASYRRINSQVPR